MEYFNFLPEEITLDILTRTPTESVLECKLVCKTWRNLVRHPSFSKIHFQHLNQSSDPGKLGFVALTQPRKLYYFEYHENHDESTNPIQGIRRISLTSPIKDAVFVGSINGLICLARGPSVCVCNPITKEHVMLPEINIDYCDADDECWMHGFGYVSSTNEFKVVGICSLESSDSLETDLQVHIYTLGSANGWRNLGNIHFEISGNGIFLNGALYWLDDELGMIKTFDLAKEKFFENLSPPGFHIDWYQCDIGVLNGFLSFAINVNGEGGCWDIWLMKANNDNNEMKEYEKHQSLGWSKEFRDDGSISLAVTKRDGVLTYSCNYLNIYDIKTSTSKRLAKFKNRLDGVSPHKNTLVSLKELGEDNTVIMKLNENKETRSREQIQNDANPDYIYL